MTAKCFVLTGSDSGPDRVYEEAIRPAVVSAHLTCRSDYESRGHGRASDFIYTELEDTNLLVAESQLVMPRFAAEIDHAQRLGIKTVLISDSPEEPAAGLEEPLIVRYSHTENGLEILQQRLNRLVEKIAATLIDPTLASTLGLERRYAETFRDLGENAELRLRVAKLLGEIDPTDWQCIGAVLGRDPSSRVRGETALSLGASRRGLGLRLLKKLAGDGVWRVRALAAEAAGASEQALELVKTLTDLATDPVGEVSEVAFAALQKIQKEDLRQVLDDDLESFTFSELFRPPSESSIDAQAFPAGAKDHGSETDSEGKAPSQSAGELGAVEATRGALSLEAAIEQKLDSTPAIHDGVKVTGEAGRPKASGDGGGPGGAKPAGRRYVNSGFVGHPDPAKPLRYRKRYTLEIQVGPKPVEGTFTSGDPRFREPDPEDPEIVVALVSEDFEIIGKAARRCWLPKNRSKPSTKVAFEVRPIKNHQRVSITVLFYQRNNLFHEARVSATVEVSESGGDESITAYRPAANLFSIPPQGDHDLNIQLTDAGDGYRFVLFYDLGGDDLDVLWCRIPVSRAGVAESLQAVRQKLLEVVDLKTAGGRTVFFGSEASEAPAPESRLPGLEMISEEDSRQAFEALARAGRSLFIDLFDAPQKSTGEQRRSQRVGEALRRLTTTRSLRIQVLSDGFFIPWNLLYVGDYPDLDPEAFWGFRHVVEELPYQKRDTSLEQVIPTPPALGIGMNMNLTAIPKVLTDPQIRRIEATGAGVHVTPRFTEGEVKLALAGKAEQHSIEYFYCHAGTEEDAPGKFDRSYLGLTSAKTGLTLEEVKLSTYGKKLRGHPLFILNACESAHMDGRFYDGFVPRFLSLGACAVVGTDSKVPSLFGAHFGMELLEYLFQGGRLGTGVLQLRKDFLERYGNPLGLIYRVFGNADLRLERGIKEPWGAEEEQGDTTPAETP